VEIKNQNLSKVSKDRLYQLLVAKDISDSERAMVKNELVKREADELFNQAQRVRKGETSQPSPGSQAARQSPSNVRKVPSFAWVVLIVLAVLISIALYATFFR
jgi:hypothetical protein